MLDLIVSHITRFLNDADAIVTGRFVLNTVYYGQADALSIKGSGILYRGEYGDINIAENITLNGRPSNCKLTKFQRMGNPELACARAVSLADFVRKTVAGNIPINERYELTISNEIGLVHRFAKVYFELKQE